MHAFYPSQASETYLPGDLIYAATDLFNDDAGDDGRSTVPEASPGALLAAAGRGLAAIGHGVGAALSAIGSLLLALDRVVTPREPGERERAGRPRGGSG